MLSVNHNLGQMLWVPVQERDSLFSELSVLISRSTAPSSDPKSASYRPVCLVSHTAHAPPALPGEVCLSVPTYTFPARGSLTGRSCMVEAEGAQPQSQTSELGWDDPNYLAGQETSPSCVPGPVWLSENLFCLPGHLSQLPPSKENCSGQENNPPLALPWSSAVFDLAHVLGKDLKHTSQRSCFVPKIPLA